MGGILQKEGAPTQKARRRQDMAHNWHMGGDGVQNALASLPHFSRLSDQKTAFFKSSAISFKLLFICRSEPDPRGPLEPLTVVEVHNTG